MEMEVLERYDDIISVISQLSPEAWASIIQGIKVEGLINLMLCSIFAIMSFGACIIAINAYRNYNEDLIYSRRTNLEYQITLGSLVCVVGFALTLIHLHQGFIMVSASEYKAIQMIMDKVLG